MQEAIGDMIDPSCSKLLHTDFGKTTGYGKPGGFAKHLFPLYSQAIHLSAAMPIDTVFIDGRFRVACALQTWMLVSTNTLVMIHDYTNRKQYHVIENYYDRIATGAELVVLRPNAEKRKDEKVVAEVMKLIESYQYNTY